MNAAAKRIVCLCGSTRFKSEFLFCETVERDAGRIVLSVETFAHADHGGHAEIVLGEDVKRRLDDLHKHKIEAADEILVIDVGGYIGSSTRGEIEHATTLGKTVRYWSRERHP